MPELPHGAEKSQRGGAQKQKLRAPRGARSQVAPGPCGPLTPHVSRARRAGHKHGHCLPRAGDTNETELMARATGGPPLAVTWGARCARRSPAAQARPAPCPAPGPAPGPCPRPARTMSTAMNFGAKNFKPRPPDKGAFPLDHFGARRASGLAPPPRARSERGRGCVAGECSASKERFMECLRRNDFQSGACRELSMAYLQCRMERQVPGGSPGPSAAPFGFCRGVAVLALMCGGFCPVVRLGTPCGKRMGCYKGC
ncbi:Cytochrome c oxidase assembly protein COX19 [Aix galericulata]|nr:Cytochrome c oxidase assembly protein COX19 [Aix galericulata]